MSFTQGTVLALGPTPPPTFPQARSRLGVVASYRQLFSDIAIILSNQILSVENTLRRGLAVRKLRLTGSSRASGG